MRTSRKVRVLEKLAEKPKDLGHRVGDAIEKVTGKGSINRLERGIESIPDRLQGTHMFRQRAIAQRKQFRKERIASESKLGPRKPIPGPYRQYFSKVQK